MWSFGRLKEGTVVWLLLVLMAIPAGLTFYATLVTADHVREAALAKFEGLAAESERSLRHRIETYKQALLGAKGFANGSSGLAREGWRNYVEALDVAGSLPGINGVGLIEEIAAEDIPLYLRHAHADGAPAFQMHPAGDHDNYFIIRYIEPEAANREAIGLNIAFEENRYTAASRARDTGRPIITKRILLVQDSEKTPGFLLLLPNYRPGMPIATEDERRAAFVNWIYAPFVGKNFLSDLTDSQGSTVHLQVYDGSDRVPDALIFDSNAGDTSDEASTHVIQKELEIMGQRWLLVWSSTPAFERLEYSNEPLLIAVIGALFTGACGVFLVVMAIRGSSEATYRSSLVAPILAFIVTAGAGGFLYAEISVRERETIANITIKEARVVRDTITRNVDSSVLALGRMAERWVVEGGSPEDEWQSDARLYVANLPGLRAVEWIDSSYHVRWVEPIAGNESAIGLDIRFNKERQGALLGSAQRETVTLTAPLDLVQGYKAFIAYWPLPMQDGFDGFIAGIFGVDDVIDAALDQSGQDFVIELTSGSDILYRSNSDQLPINEEWIHRETVTLFDQSWTLAIYPSSPLVASTEFHLAEITLLTSIVLAFLFAQLIHGAQKAKRSSALLKEKEDILSAFVKHTPAAVAMFDDKVRYLAASDRWYATYDLKGRNVTGLNHYEVIPEILEAQPDALEMYQRVIVGETIKLDEEKSVRDDGTVEWTRYELHPWRKGNGERGGMIMFTEDITERKLMDTMKDEFISTVNHELRTPLTSIQGALGLLNAKISSALDEKSRRLLTLAYENSRRLTRLVNDILDMEKMASGKMSFDIQDTEINEIVKSVVEQNLSYADRYGVVFETHLADMPIHCLLDRDRFNQALTNLLSNAAKFSKPDGKILVSVSPKGHDCVVVAVQDRGVGIPKAFHDQIYEKFAQADSSSTRSKGGTGLGLNITRSIIEALGGTISFETEEGKGSTFYFTLRTIIADEGRKTA